MVMELFYEFPGAGSLFRTGDMRVIMLHTQLFYELGDRNCTLWHLRTGKTQFGLRIHAIYLRKVFVIRSLDSWLGNLNVYTNKEGYSETVRKF